MEQLNNGFVAYEYKEINTDQTKASLYLDCYRNFGWKQDGNQSENTEKNAVVLHLKRNRKIMNKAELTRLQRNFEDCMKQIDALERSKTGTAMAVALAVGLLGTVFMALSTFAVTASPAHVIACVLFAIPGIIGWALPYFLYRKLVTRKRNVIEPLIEQKYDEIYEICEKGSKLLGLEKV